MIPNYNDAPNAVLDRIDVEKLLKLLSPKDRDTLVLYYIEGYNKPEVVKILKYRYGGRQIRRRTVEQRLKNIISKLRTHLKLIRMGLIIR